jgi:hypothetical protein
MPGVIEEGEKVAGEVVHVFNRTPLVLSLVLMNFALLGYVYYQGVSEHNLRNENIKLYIAQISEVHQLLARCVVVPPQTGEQP